MKTLFVLSALVSATVSFADVINPSKGGIVTAVMTQMHIDPNFADASRIAGGNVSVNFENKTLSLVLIRKFSCPARAMCAMVMPAPIVVELPIISMKTEGCNVKVYVASKDLRPVDGMLKTIRLVDGSRSNCFAPIPNSAELGTEFFDRMSGQAKKSYSTFELSGFAKVAE